MTQSTDKTPLLGAHKRTPRCYILPYALLLVVCVLCNLVPLIPSRILEATFSDSVGLRLFLLLLPDYLQDMLWPPLGHVLDYMASNALYGQPSFSLRRSIRKSDSLNAILKGLLLKVPSIFITFLVALRLAGLSIWLSSMLAVLCSGLMGGIAFIISVDSVRMLQGLKSKRDDALEGCTPERDDIQICYTAAMKSRERFRRVWKLLLFTGVCVLLLLATSSENTAVCIRLRHQIRSMDETYEKMVQSFPKASRVLEAMRETGGITAHILVACERVWQVRPPPLSELPELQAVRFAFNQLWAVFRGDNTDGGWGRDGDLPYHSG
ncbi:hypothetical protein QBC46DRAFT_272234 [Diplogelasinospora grovesii]|uniref:Uncharacterized protein n=1 Tax=Diplogelasinospora grovesii TaxID=303347 RepID=A0AAN6S064_9PEZI|nr:hypothetical protein QBC46DRAFT_272234 [Diplogelasinospora grovesii]